jgi:hypothetical protein
MFHLVFLQAQCLGCHSAVNYKEVETAKINELPNVKRNLQNWNQY